MKTFILLLFMLTFINCNSQREYSVTQKTIEISGEAWGMQKAFKVKTYIRNRKVVYTKVKIAHPSFVVGVQDDEFQKAIEYKNIYLRINRDVSISNENIY